MSTLLQRTRELLHASQLKRREIAEGSGVDEEWIKKFKAGKIGRPGVDKIEPLHNFLAFGIRAVKEPDAQTPQDAATASS